MKRILAMAVLMIAAPALALSQTSDKKADTTRNNNSSVEQELMQLEKDGAAAAVKGDTTFLDRHTAANYIGTDPGGGVEDRAQMMAGAKAGNIKFETQ